MKDPAGMKTYFAKIELFDDVFEISNPEFLLDDRFAFITNGQFSSFYDLMAAGTEFEWPHFERCCLQGYPYGNCFICLQWPIVLVGMPRSDATTAFFE